MLNKYRGEIMEILAVGIGGAIGASFDFFLVK